MKSTKKAYASTAQKKKQKEEALMEEISRARKVEGIHAARLGRVLEEPGIDEPQVVIRVRHIDLGMVKRMYYSEK